MARTTDVEFLLEVLEDRQEHELGEIMARSVEERGCGMTIHSRVSDLRKRGYNVKNHVVHKGDGRPLSYYRLVGLKEASAQDPPAGVSLSPGVIVAVSEEEEWEGLRTLDDFPVPAGDAEGFAESSGEQLGLLGQAGAKPGAYPAEAA